MKNDIYIQSEDAVVGHNEDGEVIGTVYFVQACFSVGTLMNHFKRFADERKAGSLLADIWQSVAAGKYPKWDEYWTEADPIYGSERHQQIGDFHLMDHEELEGVGA